MKAVLIFLLSFVTVAGAAQTQPAPSSPHKIHEVFLDYLTEKIDLTPTEKKQLQPLVIRYLSESKNLYKTNRDPLLREQERIKLKINYRKLFTPIIGEQRATRFFGEEQLFRRKIREELKKRNVKEN
ncbi:hypothetical protein [Niabella drilacis]|uniref:Uncharacterized protein n=1 Tax=Niabella drilacis (strain DSM 25811 / CCM 8410 / CCUG 62505 / LMG 26954 / E90) TaxID=1285928 RepID=A0A1G6NUV3_NIADE|nr:hypothetical protein [Niabella drilacis]SDC71421.1 hypothetical protein SAMN04487894_103398 [Niabella drilacis]